MTVCRLTETQAIAMAVYSNSLGTASPAFEPWSTASVDRDVLHLLAPVTETNSTAERCYLSHSRSSVLQGLPFGGVPTVLAINLVVWLVWYFSLCCCLQTNNRSRIGFRDLQKGVGFFFALFSFHTKRFNLEM